MRAFIVSRLSALKVKFYVIRFINLRFVYATYLLTYTAQHNIVFGGYIVRYKVIATDYSSWALVYQCHGGGASVMGRTQSGRCRRNQEQVEILSRRDPAEGTFDAFARRQAYDAARQSLCVDIYDFVKTDTGRLRLEIITIRGSDDSIVFSTVAEFFVCFFLSVNAMTHEPLLLTW